MVIEYKPTESDPSKFVLKEMVDCCDSGGRWLNGEIVELLPEGFKVHFTGFHRKFDEVVPNTPSRVLKQYVLDPTGKWLEARVIDMNEKQINVHYRNFHDKFNEWLPNRIAYLGSDRIREIGTYSPAYGIGKIDPMHPSKIAAKIPQPEVRAPQLPENKEARFRQLLLERGLFIQPVEADGNCQFRSVSHQLYGSTQFHAEIRAAVISYLNLEREYFAQFVVDGLEKFDDYLQYKAKNGAWGDDVELQAMSEIYNRPIEVYAYANTPLRTFHEQANGREPLRIAYHGGSHYNSIVSENFVPLLQTPPGEWEHRAMQEAGARAASRLAMDEEIARSRETFDRQSQQALQDALQLSLQESIDPELQDALQSSMLETTESDLLHQALQESAREQPAEDEQVRMALELSMQEQQLHPAILQALEMGFSMEQAMQAMSIVGDVPEAVVEYLLCTLK